ncbi:MAG: hypothetical protein ACNI3C_00635 [Candidatus Marinarcus sp.]|uniref:hypothetical protein n=1 Tax=Candidatus Marinarcus sp. TaxID=3100987 RepID=UPI003AFFAB88
MKILFQVCIVVAIVAGYFLIDFNSLYNSFRGEGEFTLQNKECSLKESPCSVQLPDGTQFELEIFPKDIPLMKPLTFKLKSSNKELTDLKLRIYATNMMMGTFELTFINNGNGEYSTNGVLPTCPVGGMKWNADVELSKFNKIVGARYQFETDF